jgi:Glycosyl transferase family 2
MLHQQHNASESHDLRFLNSLKLPINFTALLSSTRPNQQFRGVNHLKSFVVLAQNDSHIYDIDIRYTNSNLIFLQDLVDHGWKEEFFKQKISRLGKKRKKIIIYLCENDLTDYRQERRLCAVSEQFNLGTYWKNIFHYYISASNVDWMELDDLQQKKNLSLISSSVDRSHFPRITVVTVVFNGESLIEQTIQSVINQTYANLEYIIIDGASTDKTVEIIRQYERHISFWKSEPDLGLFDAMNKAFDYATGDFINFMNVGDLFFSPHSIEMLSFDDPCRSVCGTNIFFSTKTNGLMYSQTKDAPHGNHQSLFMSRNDFELFRFNVNFKYTADTHLWRFLNLKKTEKVSYQHVTVSISRFGGISTSSKKLIPRMLEHLEYDKNRFATFMRFIPKIILSRLLPESWIEYLYFKINSTSGK